MNMPMYDPFSVSLLCIISKQLCNLTHNYDQAPITKDLLIKLLVLAVILCLFVCLFNWFPIPFLIATYGIIIESSGHFQMKSTQKWIELD